MTQDIIIRGGQLVDGTGSSSKHADVAIKDGIITEIGKVDGKSEYEIDFLKNKEKNKKNNILSQFSSWLDQYI